MKRILHFPGLAQGPLSFAVDSDVEKLLELAISEDKELESLLSSDPPSDRATRHQTELQLARKLDVIAEGDRRVIDYLARQSLMITPSWDKARGSTTYWRSIIEEAVALNGSNFTHECPEIIEGVLREGQIGVMTGYYGVGKTPLVQDCVFHVTNGMSWLGRRVFRREVVLIDFETPCNVFHRNLSRLVARYPGVWRLPKSFLISTNAVGDDSVGDTFDWSWDGRFKFLYSLLQDSPQALVVIDPLEHLFRLNRNKSSQLLSLFLKLRQLLVEFPHAAILGVVNYGRRGRRRVHPSLLKEPVRWLEGNSGNLDILNRCDVRLGFDFHDDPEFRVIHGVRRGEAMSPIIVRQLGEPSHPCGFHPVNLDTDTLQMDLTRRQREHWRQLPPEFHFMEIVKSGIVPKSSLSRLVRDAKELGILVSQEGVYRKI